MEDPLINPVILCGGSGTRLWPLSRKSYPKQFSSLLGEQSLFQGTVIRLAAPGFAPPLVVTGDPFRFIVTDQLAETDVVPNAFLIEPETRNTAPAVLAAALWLHEQNGDTLMLIAPSDHAIPDEAAFQAAIKTASRAASDGQIVTFGVTPTRPETGYGYLEMFDEITSSANHAQPLKSFVEKPDAETAKEFFHGKRHLWNAGIFMFRVEEILEAFEVLCPRLIMPVA